MGLKDAAGSEVGGVQVLLLQYAGRRFGGLGEDSRLKVTDYRVNGFWVMDDRLKARVASEALRVTI